jgi:hypothetical protein
VKYGGLQFPVCYFIIICWDRWETDVAVAPDEVAQWYGRSSRRYPFKRCVGIEVRKRAIDDPERGERIGRCEMGSGEGGDIKTEGGGSGEGEKRCNARST